MRTTIVGAAIVASVLTLGPGASAFVLEHAFEKAVRGQCREEKRAKVELEKEFKEQKQGCALSQINQRTMAMEFKGGEVGGSR